jgi:iduronate 2-sulfatase
MGYSIRTQRYRYTFWNEGREGEELYDYHTDPGELHNLAADHRMADLKATLRSNLEETCRKRGMANTPGTFDKS